MASLTVSLGMHIFKNCTGFLNIHMEENHDKMCLTVAQHVRKHDKDAVSPQKQ